jgi:hypothetical protein
MRWIALLVTVGASLLASAEAHAQLHVSSFPIETATSSPYPSALLHEQANAAIPRLVAGGVVGGIAGFFLFGYAGAVIADTPDSNEGFDELAGFVVGATIGESLGIPVGVHLANRREGKVLPAILASLGIGAAGLALALVAEGSGPLPAVILGVTPIAQFVSSIHIEHATAGR